MRLPKCQTCKGRKQFESCGTHGTDHGHKLQWADCARQIAPCPDCGGTGIDQEAIERAAKAMAKAEGFDLKLYDEGDTELALELAEAGLLAALEDTPQ